MKIKDIAYLLTSLDLPFLESLNASEIIILARHFEIEKFHPNSFITKEAAPSLGLYVLVEGEAQRYSKIVGHTVQGELLTKGDYIEAISLLGGIAFATIKAKSEIISLFLSHETYMALSITYPKLIYKMNKSIIQLSKMTLLKNLTQLNSFLNTDTAISKLTDRIRVVDFVLPTVSSPISESLLRSMDISYEFLKNIRLFPTLNEEDIVHLVSYMALLKLKKDTRITSQLRPAKHTCYNLVQGAIQICKVHNNMKLSLAILSPGNVFDFSLLDPDSHFLNYIIREDAIIFELNEKSFNSLRYKHPQLFYKYNFCLCCNLAQIIKSIYSRTNQLLIETKTFSIKINKECSPLDLKRYK